MVAATFASVCRQLGSRVGEADVLDSLGRVYRRQVQLGLAADYQQQALALYRQICDRGGEAVALNSLGETLEETGNLEQARRQHTEALAVAVESGVRYEQARAHNGIAASH